MAKGFQQRQGIDFEETFNSVVKHSTICIILSLAVTQQWKLHQLDVRNAFLQGKMKKEVFMFQPPGILIHSSRLMYANSSKQYTVLNKHHVPGIIDYESIFFHNDLLGVWKTPHYLSSIFIVAPSSSSSTSMTLL